MSAINPPADYNYELKTGYIKQLLENTGEQLKKKKRLEGIQFLKEESTLGVIHIYTDFLLRTFPSLHGVAGIQAEKQTFWLMVSEDRV